MYITNAKIENYRALQTVSITLNKFIVLLGENDVGKTSFLYALDVFFQNKKISDQDSYFKRDISNTIKIILTFGDTPDDYEISHCKRSDGTIIISKEFPFDQFPNTKLISDDGSECSINTSILRNWFLPRKKLEGHYT